VAAGVIKQKCPFCEEMLDYEIKSADGTKNDRGGVSYNVNAQTTPESTAHVWTHAPKELA
jgi:hypothetical protein